MCEPYETTIISVVKACRIKDQISQAEAAANLALLRSEPETRDLAQALEMILAGARIKDRLLIMVDSPQDMAVITEVLSRLQGEAECHLGVTIMNGTRKFDPEERERIKGVLSRLPPAHLRGIRVIRAERSSEDWLGRFWGNEGLIELNQGWEDRTLHHEIGHSVFEHVVSQTDKDRFAVLHARSKKPSDFADD